jgi:hypothetical protein
MERRKGQGKAEKNPDECSAFVWVHRKERGIKKGVEVG